MERAAEHDLIRRATAGEQDAAAELIRAHQKSVYSYLLRMCGRPALAEDITQEAFVRVLTNLHRFDFRYRFSTWLFTIARRLYLNAMAKHKPAYDTDFVGSMRGRGERPEESIYTEERRRVQRDALQEALDEISPVQREILILFHQQDWPIVLIAEHLDMPEGTVKSHLHRGRKRLRALLTEHEHLARLLNEVGIGAGGAGVGGVGVGV